MANAPTLWVATNSNTLFELTGSAQWQPVAAWEEENGKRRPSSRQLTDSAGLPIWEIRVIANIDSFGRKEESFLTLRVASSSKPEREVLESLVVAA